MSPTVPASMLCGIILAILILKCFSLELNPTKTTGDIDDRGFYPRYGDIPMLNRKVVKGRRVTIGEHPYIVSIRRNVAHYLTGTMLKWNIVLTVAHPLVKVPITELTIVVGENYCDRGSRLNTVLFIFFHDDFDPNTLEADLALLNFYSPFPLKSIKPINLIRTAEVNGTGFVTGWGRCDLSGKEFCLPRSSIYNRGEIQDIMLKSITIQIKYTEYCDAYIRHGLSMKPGMMCMGTARMEHYGEPCMAVPGAPLVHVGRLLAIQSWGFGCGYPTDLPIVYTSIYYYRTWIQSTSNIMAAITNDDFKLMFDATKAAILYESMYNTRTIKLKNVHGGELTTWPIDKYLKHINGSVFDIRDFYAGGRYHVSKLLAYESVKDKDIKEITVPTTSSTDIDIIYQEEDFEGLSDHDYGIEPRPGEMGLHHIHEPHNQAGTDYPELDNITLPLYDELIESHVASHTTPENSQTN